MKLGIVGLEGAGRATIFEALTQNAAASANPEENRLGTVKVPDDRVDALSEIYHPKKTIYAQVAYLLPGKSTAQKTRGSDSGLYTKVRDCDALLHVVRNFAEYGMDAPLPAADFTAFDQELIFSDLVVVEKRLERLELDQKRGKPGDPEEVSLLKACLEKLEAEIPLRTDAELASAPCLRGYAFLSAKPCLAVVNNGEDDTDIPEEVKNLPGAQVMAMRGKLEQELAQMDAEEATAFLSEFGITETAAHRVIHRSYALLGLISFFTVGEDEVRAWTVPENSLAPDAAGAIHTDMKKGFIRAEVLAYDDLMACKTFAAARKKGLVRLEGKTYPVKDGDIINVRFNV